MKKSKLENCSVPKKDMKATWLRKNKIKISCFLIFIFCVVLVSCFYNFAKSEHKLGEFFDFWSNAILQYNFALLAEGGAIVILKYKTKKRLWFLVPLCLSVTISILSICGIFEIKAMCLKESENNNYSDKEILNKTDNIEKCAKMPYVFENDKFFENGVEVYVGLKKGSLNEENEIVKHMASVLFEDMKSINGEDNGIPNSYCEHTQMADLLYKTYTYQCTIDLSDKSEKTIKAFNEKRIDNLKNSKDERILGDKEYEDCENRRLISVISKELGDEYERDDNQDEASKMFKESIEWAMRSLYTAYTKRNYEKMKTIYSDLDNSVSAYERLDENDGENARLCCDAYKLIIDEYLPY